MMKNITMIKIFLAAITIILLPEIKLSIAQENPGENLAQQQQQEKEEIARKSVAGEVSGLAPNFIAVLYGQSQESQAALEMAFDLDKDVKIEHRKSLKEINMGDTVEVAYLEITKTREDGRKISRRVAKVITFVRASEKQPETNVLQSRETVAEP